jgi:AcrR family transcriptional regulator
MRLTQAERTEVSDRRMVKTTIELIVQKGINGMTLAEVGLRAGYSRGLASVRFGTKAGLLRQVAHHTIQGWLRRINSATSQKAGLEAVLAAIDTQGQWMTEEPAEMRVLYLIYFYSLDPSAEYHLNVSKILAAQRRDLTRWILEAIHRGEIDPRADPSQEAEQILSAMLGIVYQTLMDRELPAQRLHTKLKADLRARLQQSASPGRIAPEGRTRAVTTALRKSDSQVPARRNRPAGD